MRTTHSHIRLIRCMKQMGYAIEKGVCQGVAHMGMQAIHAGFSELEIFNNRLVKLFEIYDVSLQETSLDIHITTQETFDARFLEILKSKLNADAHISGIPAFFDGIALYQDPLLHKQCFERVTRQDDTDSTFAIVKSVAIEQENISAVQNGIFYGVYSQEELTNFFDELSLALESQLFEQPISITLQSVHHTIAVGYYPADKKWFLIDANRLPVWCYLTNAEIAQVILSTYPDNGFICFSMKIYAPVTQHAALENILNACSDNINDEKIIFYDGFGAGLFHLAAQEGNLDIIRKCIAFFQANHLSIDPVTTNGESPLSLAVSRGQHDAATILLSAGANFNLYIDGRSILHLTTKSDDVVMLKILLDYGMDFLKSSMDGFSLIHLAAAEGSVNITNELIALGVNSNLQMTSNSSCFDGGTALFYAAQQNHLNLLVLLLRNGANPDLPRRNGDTHFSLRHFWDT